MPYLLMEHEPDVWLQARIEKQWRHQARWRLSAYYYVGLLQHYRIYDADQCRPVSAAELQDDDQRHTATGHKQPESPHKAAEQLAPVVRGRGHAAPT